MIFAFFHITLFLCDLMIPSEFNSINLEMQ